MNLKLILGAALLLAALVFSIQNAGVADVTANLRVKPKE